MTFAIPLVIFASCLPTTANASDGIEATQLKCDYRLAPMGVDGRQPRLSWELVDPNSGAAQIAFQVQCVAATDLFGSGQSYWDTGRIPSTSQTISYSGPALAPRCGYKWRVRVWNQRGEQSEWSELAGWETGLLENRNWLAKWITSESAAPTRDEDFYGDDPAFLFRKSFDVAQPIQSARLYISGLGYYVAELNGRRIGKQRLSPAWTDYRDVVHYDVQDVTRQLQQGHNVLGVTVGNGWWNPLPLRMWGWLNLRDHLPVGRPCLIAQLVITNSNGDIETIVSDESWRAKPGPTRRNSVYLGEFYDARFESLGWSQPGLDDNSWASAVLATQQPNGKLIATDCPPILATAELAADSVRELDNRTWLVDFGKNFSGAVRVGVQGQAGRPVTFRYGELLTDQGELNSLTSVCGQIKKPNLGGAGAPALAEQCDIYVPRSSEPTDYTPEFTSHGFRYMEVSNVTQPVTASNVRGIVLRSAVDSAMQFECSDPYLNRLQLVCRQTFESNLTGIQTDCPHRERFGYGGDIVVTTDSMMLNYDMATFHRKTIRDFAAAAGADGSLPETAPYVGVPNQKRGGRSGPVCWGLAHPWLLERHYRYYGDRELVAEQYPVALRWLRFLGEVSNDGIVAHGLGDHESVDATNIALVETAHYHRAAYTLASLADALGMTKEAAEHRRLAEQIKIAFRREFVDSASGIVRSSTQAAQSIVIDQGLILPTEQTRVMAKLVETINARGGRLSTGIFGTPALLCTLSHHQRGDLALKVVRQREVPGWGYMLDRGATTLWEHWQWSDDVYSHNHPMFGSVSQWLIETVAGLAVADEAVGCDRVIISPRLAGPLAQARATYRSVRGPISCDWRVVGDHFTLLVDLPPGVRGSIRPPVELIGGLRHVGQDCLDEKDQPFVPRLSSIEVGAGRHQFEGRLSNDTDKIPTESKETGT